MAEEDKSAEPRTTATKQPAVKKTTAKKRGRQNGIGNVSDA